MNFDPNIDYYEVLGIHRGATTAEINARYTSISPKTVEIDEAFRVLSSVREAYDMWTAPSVTDPNDFYFDDDDFRIDDEEDLETEDTDLDLNAEDIEEEDEPAEPEEDGDTPEVAAVPANPIVAFFGRWVTCLIIVVLAPVYCLLSLKGGFGSSVFSFLFFALLPIGIVGLVFFLQKGKNKKRTALIGVVVLAIGVALVLILQAAFSPVIKGPEDIVNSITSGVGDLVNIEKTLAVPGDVHALDVPATATSVPFDKDNICGALSAIMHYNETKVWLDAVPNWPGSTSFNIFVYWKINGESRKINPARDKTVTKEFRSVKSVTIDYIDTIQSGKTAHYQCSS